MSVGSPTAGTWSSSQWQPDNEFETDTILPSNEASEKPGTVQPTSVIPHRPVRILSVGIVRARDDSCNNAKALSQRAIQDY